MIRRKFISSLMALPLVRLLPQAKQFRPKSLTDEGVAKFRSGAAVSAKYKAEYLATQRMLERTMERYVYAQQEQRKFIESARFDIAIGDVIQVRRG